MAPRRDLTPADAVWLYSEWERNHQTVSGVMWTDRIIDPEEFRHLVQTRLLDVYPVFQQKVVMSRNPLMMPHWEDDPAFDIDNHIEVVQVPAPGDKEQVQQIVSEQRSLLLDRDRPLWKFYLLQGYEGDKTVFHGRIQHSIADGWALVRLILSLADEEGRTERIKPVDKEPKEKQSLVDKATAPIKSVAGAATSAATSALGGIKGHAAPGAVLATGKDALDETMSLGADPGRFVEFGASVPDKVVEKIQSAAEKFLGAAGSATGKLTAVGEETVNAAKLAATGVRDGIEFTFPPKPGQTKSLHGEASGTKRLVWAEPVALEGVKAVGKKFGGTLNDVMLAALTNGLRKYLLEHDDLTVENLMVAMPVSLRRPDDPLPRTLGNKFGLVPVMLPVSIEDPVEQLTSIHEQIEEIKSSQLPIVSFGLTSISAITTPEVERQIHKMNQAHSTGVVTNVPGPRNNISIAGAKVLGMMGFGGVSAHMNVTVAIFSLAGQINLGVATDAAITPDPERIQELTLESLAELQELAGV